MKEPTVSAIASLVSVPFLSSSFFFKGICEQCEREKVLMQSFLPEQADTAQVQQLIAESIRSTAAASVKDMRKVMAELGPQLEGKFNPKLLGSMVKKELENVAKSKN
jgi:uncharacterized protein YqeY